MFTSQSLTRSGALNVNTGCQERVRVRGHRGRGVHGWMVSVIVSEQERSWEAVSGGPESLSCFRAPLSGSSPALAAGRTFLVHEAHVHHRKGDGSGCQRGVTWTPAPRPPSSARGGIRPQAVRHTCSSGGNVPLNCLHLGSVCACTVNISPVPPEV